MSRSSDNDYSIESASHPNAVGPGAADSGEAQLALHLALEGSCNALIALQISLASLSAITSEHEAAETDLRTAIESVRLAVTDLRELLPAAQVPLAFGFVSRRGRRSNDAPAGADQ